MFTVNVPAVDYLTLTSYNHVIWGHIQKWIVGRGDFRSVDAKRMQYTGYLYTNRDGSLFLGQGEQKGEAHYLAQCSGFLADDLLVIASYFIKEGYVRVTRIDLQITVEYPRGTTDLAAIANAMREHGDRSVSYVESKSGPRQSKLSTIYYGSRRSDRFYRIYEKMGMDEDVFLRFEVEFKSPRSQVVASALCGTVEVAQILAHEIDQLPEWNDLDWRFLAVLHDPERFNPIAVAPEANTLKWLRTQVAPALDRVLNDHNLPTEEIVTLFMRILTPHM